jgi:hypothetical protein
LSVALDERSVHAARRITAAHRDTRRQLDAVSRSLNAIRASVREIDEGKS